MRPFIELDGVWFSHGEVRVLEDINLAVQPGDFLGLIGPNGSGKTTLLRIVLGLLRPERGSARLFGKPPTEFREWSRVGYVPQRATIDPTLPATVDEVVATGLVPTQGLFRRPGPRERARIGEVLARVGMEAHRSTRIGALSPGQQQRVLIARALVSDPELLILDEPTTGVDPEAQTSFYALLHHLNREREVTLILVSHDVGVVANEVNKLACLNRRLVFHGRPADFLSEAALTALYGPGMRVVSHRHESFMDG
jgi:zinc transport system ATP-binding protein